MDPLIILLVGIIAVIGMIVVLRLNPFLALIAGALIVSFLATPAPGTEGDWVARVTRVATALGETAGKLMILIVMGALIGQAMMRSGAADRIVQTLIHTFGKKHLPSSLMSSGFLISIPVFYDVTFYLLLPLVQAVYRLTQKNYVYYLLAIGFGAMISHSLVPSTPGPLVAAEMLNVPIGMMMFIGGIVGVLTIPPALLIARYFDARLPNPIIENENVQKLLEPMERTYKNTSENILVERRLPSFFASILPIILPVVLVGSATMTKSLTNDGIISWSDATQCLYQAILFFGDSHVALMLAAGCALAVLFFVQKLSLREIEKEVGVGLQAAGMIILITAAGGAFGSMLNASGVGERIQEIVLAGNGRAAGLVVLLIAFLTSCVIKIAQGSGTTAMITTASIFATMGLTTTTLGFNPGYVAVAIGAGSCVTSWMNDSAFCVFATMSGLKETDVLRTWTLGLGLVGIISCVVTMIMSQLLPLL